MDIMIELLQNSIVSIVTAVVAIIILAIILRQVFLLKGEIKKQTEQHQAQINNYREIFKLVQNNDGLKLKPIRKCIRMEIKNCRQLFKQQQLYVKSNTLDVLGSSWYLEASTGKKGFSPYICIQNRRLALMANIGSKLICSCLSILNAYHSLDLINESFQKIYENVIGTKTGYGIQDFAKLEDLLDPVKGFLRPDGSIEVEADFTIKSSTLDHLF